MKHKIFYLGLNNETLILLCKEESIKVIGINYFEYFNHYTINPLDYVFKLVYFLHFKNKLKNFKMLLFKIWNVIYFLSSKIYKNNREYLKSILDNQIKIIDTEDSKYFSYFIKKNEIDLLIINSWGIIPSEILILPKYKTLNVHPSLLPMYRGALPTLWSLKNNDNKTGLTYIVLNEFIDDGMIIGQHQFDIEEFDDWYDLEEKISQILKLTLIPDILSYLDGSYNVVINEIEPSYTGYYYKYSKIDLVNENFKDIYNKVGLYPYIEPFFCCNLTLLNKKIYIKKVSFCKNLNKIITPGRIILGFGFILFHSKDGILKSHLFRDISFNASIFIIYNKIIHRI
jgi:methionyl-tRNA formyltransferase